MHVGLILTPASSICLISYEVKQFCIFLAKIYRGLLWDAMPGDRQEWTASGHSPNVVSVINREEGKTSGLWSGREGRRTGGRGWRRRREDVNTTAATTKKEPNWGFLLKHRKMEDKTGCGAREDWLLPLNLPQSPVHVTSINVVLYVLFLDALIQIKVTLQVVEWIEKKTFY